MEITCADCGCLVERGIVIVPCDQHPDCCCGALPLLDAVDPMLEGKHPAERTEDRALAPARGVAPALDGPHAFDEPADDREQQVQANDPQ
jgi:hypothetical protein